MTQPVLNLLPTVAAPAAASASAGKSTGAVASDDGDLFRVNLASELVAGPTKPTAAAAVPDANPTTALGATIAQLLDSGASRTDVIASLSSSLAKLKLTAPTAAPDGAPTTALTAKIKELLAAGVSRTEVSAALTSTLAKLAQSTSAPAAAVAQPTALTALTAKITKLLNSGASQTEVIASLATSLATSVSATLGISSAQARSKLQAAFASTLAPPSASGATGAASTARTVRDLAERYAAIQTAATALAERQSGQQNRIAGTVLDARGAKDTPAPSTIANPPASVAATVPLDAGNVAAPVLPAATGSGSVVSPVAGGAENLALGAHAAQPSSLPPGAEPAPSVTAAGDGRTVNFGLQPALASGGDTLLGRILTRASVAAVARDSVAAARPALAGRAHETSASAAASGDGSAAEAATPDESTTLTAFLKSFAASMTSQAPTADSDAGGATVAAPAATQHQSTEPAPSFVPGAAPFAIEHHAEGPTPAAPAARVDPSDIADQVLRGAFLRNVGQSSEMRLSLVPESLGDVSVKLVVGAGGSVSAHIVADTSEARDALVAAQPQLSKSLADAGLKLSGFTVDLSNNGFGSSTNQQNDPQGNARRQSAVIAVAPADAADESHLDAIPSFGPSIADPTSDYNYLA